MKKLHKIFNIAFLTLAPAFILGATTGGLVACSEQEIGNATQEQWLEWYTNTRNTYAANFEQNKIYTKHDIVSSSNSTNISGYAKLNNSKYKLTGWEYNESTNECIAKFGDSSTIGQPIGSVTTAEEFKLTLEYYKERTSTYLFNIDENGAWFKFKNYKGETAVYMRYNKFGYLTNEILNINDGDNYLEINITYNKDPYLHPFAQNKWSTVIKAINEFEESDQKETAMIKLCDTFGDTPYISNISSEITDKNRQIEAHLANFIGKEQIVEINGQEHIVRVIGINHDLLEGETDKYAAFTFEMVTLLSDSTGVAISSIWDSTNNYDYTNSVLRKNLTGEGNGTFGWDSSHSSIGRTALAMLPTELQSAIKTVNKKVATYNSETSQYEVGDGYNDKLFPLTYTEMAQTSSEDVKIEGSAYAYWITFNDRSFWRKWSVSEKKTDFTYWLISPALSSPTLAWAEYSVGGISRCSLTDTSAVSFAFCI